jgi:hypothetical protein
MIKELSMIPQGMAQWGSWWWVSSTKREVDKEPPSSSHDEVTFNNTLPDEIISKILSNLSDKRLKICCNVCKKWKISIDNLEKQRHILQRSLTWNERTRRVFNSIWYGQAWKELNKSQNATYPSRLTHPAVPPFAPVISPILKSKGQRLVVKTEKDLLEEIRTIFDEENLDQRIAIRFRSVNNRNVRIKIFFEKTRYFNSKLISLNPISIPDIQSNPNKGKVEKVIKSHIPAFFESFDYAVRTYVIRDEEEADYTRSYDDLLPLFDLSGFNKPNKGYVYIMFIKINPGLQTKINTITSKRFGA